MESGCRHRHVLTALRLALTDLEPGGKVVARDPGRDLGMVKDKARGKAQAREAMAAGIAGPTRAHRSVVQSPGCRPPPRRRWAATSG